MTGEKPRSLGMCMWFVRCAHPAVAVEQHPVLGQVAICQRCLDNLRKIESELEKKP